MESCINADSTAIIEYIGSQPGKAKACHMRMKICMHIASLMAVITSLWPVRNHSHLVQEQKELGFYRSTSVISPQVSGLLYV